MSIDVTAAEDALRDDVVDRLRAHDIRYIGGGNAWSGRPSLYREARDAPVGPLVLALARSRDPRLRAALVALLLRHPEYAPAALREAENAPVAENAQGGVHTARLIAVSVLVAAALQRAWAFSLDLYLPGWSPIAADALARRLGVPSPSEDYGRATLDALDALLVRDDPFPTDYRGAWEDVGCHALDDLREESLADVAP